MLINLDQKQCLLQPAAHPFSDFKTVKTGLQFDSIQVETFVGSSMPVSLSDSVTSYTFSQDCQLVWNSRSLGKGKVMVCMGMIMLKSVKTCKRALLLNESRKQHFKFSKLSLSFLLSSSALAAWTSKKSCVLISR